MRPLPRPLHSRLLGFKAWKSARKRGPGFAFALLPGLLGLARRVPGAEPAAPVEAAGIEAAGMLPALDDDAAAGTEAAGAAGMPPALDDDAAAGTEAAGAAGMPNHEYNENDDDAMTTRGEKWWVEHVWILLTRWDFWTEI